MKRILLSGLLVIYFSCCILQSSFSQNQGQAKLDKLLEQYKTTEKKDTGFISLLNDIAFEYYQIDSDLGIKYGLEGLLLAEKLKSKPHQAKMCNSLAVNYWSQSKYTEALLYFSRALAINQEIGDKNSMARNMGNMGMVYYNLSDYPKALEYYFQAVKINVEMGNREGMANKYSNIGLVYDKQKIYNKALEYYNKSLEINTALGNKNGIAINLGNIGNTYSSMKEYSKAVENHLKALDLDLELGNKRGISSDYGNLGEVYTDLAEYEQAIQYQNKALEIRKEINNRRGIMFSYGGLAEIYLKLSQDEKKSLKSAGSKSFYIEKCLEYSRMAVDIGKKINALKETADWYQFMARAYSEMNDWKTALLYTDSFNILQDSVFNQETRLRMSNIQSKREMEMKEKEMELMKTKNERRRIAIIAVSGGLLLVLVISGLIYRNLHHKSKISKLLQEKYQLSVTQKDSMQIANNMLQKEVNKATHYLTSLLPAPIDQGPFHTDYLFIPSRQLGGDCFGYHWIDENHFAIYILDVCGHGISSALHSVSVLNLLKSTKRLNTDPRHPEKVVKALNESFRMEDHGDLFFSIWYGVLRISDHEFQVNSNPDLNKTIELSYTCAGHPNPLLFDPSGEIRELGPSSLAVGCMPGIVFPRHRAVINPGSKLLLFSDGTYEVSRKDGSIMDISEFKTMVINSYHKNGLSLKHINELVAKHNSMENYDDDFSLLMIHCQS